MKPSSFAHAVVALTAAVVPAVSAALAATAGAAPLGPTLPAWCTAHTSFDGSPDVPDDYRCAGMAIEYHTAGVAYSPFPIWAGQWAFTDTAGDYHLGYCTMNRAHHPTVAAPSVPVAQTLPNDPTGAKAGYLMWRHGDTQDPLTAAALWAVAHYYAQDAAGTNRAATATYPLVPRLDMLQAASGRADLQETALALDAEAQAMSGEWALTLALDPHPDLDPGQPDPTPEPGAGLAVTITLLAGATPVPGQEVLVHVSGRDLPLAATTGTEGTTTVTVDGPLSGTVTVVATADAPGPPVVYRGTPASPDPHGAQTQLTAGVPRTLRAEATADAPEPTTTTTEPEPTTTTTPPERELATTTTTEPAPTTTTAPEPTTTTTPPTVTIAETPTTTPPIPTTPLPRTGGRGDGSIGYLATAFLVGGIGLLGTLRRRDLNATRRA